MHRYERRFLLLSLVVLAGFVVAIALGTLTQLAVLPHGAGTVDPTTLLGPDAPEAWQAPYVRPVDGASGAYEAHAIALRFGFIPPQLEVPANSSVTFHLTSTDVIHGFYVPGTGVNAMLIPGYVTTFTLHFGEPAEYDVICHEYCGLGHHFMEMGLAVVPEDQFETEAAGGGGAG